MKLSTLLVVIFVGVATVPVAHAQMAAAIGKPLPSPDLPAGEVSVRIIAGSPANGVIGTDVTLVVNGTPRVARTDSAGRAIFKDLPSEATVQAKAVDDDKKEISSDSFKLPSDNGVRLMLTTRPLVAGGGGAAPFAGGAAGMPEPRQMSGEPRPEQSDAPGTYTVRLTYNDFKDTPPQNVPVTLVGYSADERVTVQIKQTDKEGRAQFTGLDRSGATAYFAMTEMARNGAIDRLVAKPVVLDAQLGVRLVLSSDKRASTAPPIDELARLDPQQDTPPAGKVVATLSGVPAASTEILLVDAATKAVVAKALPQQAAPDPTDVNAQAQFEPKADVPAGTIDVQVHGGAGSDNEPLKDISIKISPAGAGIPMTTGGVESKTPESGTVRLAVQQPKGAQLVATFMINGKPLSSQPFDLTKTGGLLDVEAHWERQGKLQVVWDVTPTPQQVFYVEATMRGQRYRTEPFQTVDGHGTHVTLFIYPRVLFSFSLTSHIDDQFLAISGRFVVENNSWAPYVASPDGMVLPLPRNFKGAIVAERDQGDVSVAPGEGYRIVRPIPPGSREFHGAFSLPVENGNVEWALDLPWGAFQSGIEILTTPEMSVKLPDNVPPAQKMTVPQGTYFVLQQIQILPRQAMLMTVAGLPSPASWRVWTPRIIGILVISLMLGGLWFALSNKKPIADAARAAKRAQLLDELVELEKAGKADKKREALVAELEKLWD